MAKVVDPDDLALIVNPDSSGDITAEEIVIETDAKTIEATLLGSIDDSSPGSTSGVTLQCIYSFLKEEWRTNATLNQFKFPIKAIYEAKFVMQYGWSWQAQQTRDVIRDAGWQEIDGAEWACVISLGSQYDSSQQANYQQVTGFDQATTDFDKTGALDEAVEIYDGTSGDYRDYLKLFLREWERTYADYNLLVEQGFSALTYIAYRAPLANADDIKNDGSVTQAFIDGANQPYEDMELQYYRGALFAPAAQTSYSVDDVVLDGDSPQRWARCTGAGTITGGEAGPWASFTGTATWEAYPGERQIGTNYYAFNRAVQYNSSLTAPTKEQIYLFCQNELTKASDINDDPETETYGTVNGEVAVRLAYWVGDILHSWPGVNFDDFHSNDTNNIVLHDITAGAGASYGLDSEDVPNTSTERTYPFTAAGNMVFSQNLVDETNADTLYRMYFKYIYTQERADFAVTGAAGASATLETVAGGFNLTAGDYFTVAGFTTNDENNGVKVVDAAASNGLSVDYTDALGRTQVNETLGDTVTVDEQPFDTASAIVVNDNGASPIEGQVTTQNISFDFNYDGNVQGGRTASTDAVVIVVAQGLNDSEWVFAEFTITATTGLSFPVNAPDELTYLNP
jgi:hypothetical protein